MSEKKLTDKTRVSLSIGAFILVLVFIVSSVFALGAWKNNIENEISDIESNCCRIEELEKSDIQQSIQFAEIKKDLEYIKVMIIAVQQELKK